MLLAVEILILCLVFWGACWLGTGTDEKNVKGLSSYPDEVQRRVKADPVLGKKVRISSPSAAFLSNVVLFAVLFLPLNWMIRGQGFLVCFIRVLLMGEVLNAFDFLVMDLLWWRHTRRIRFTGTEDQPQLYQDPRHHFESFLRGIFAFLCSAAIDGLILSLI